MYFRYFIILSVFTAFWLCETRQRKQQSLVDSQFANCSKLDCMYHFTGNPSWSIVNGTCRVFPNDCILNKLNCIHRSMNMTEYPNLTKEECQMSCPTSCDINKLLLPVCANFIYMAGPRASKIDLTFPSQCHLDKWSCWNGIPFMLPIKGICS
ncbi:uncharacterized protein LOC119686218 [Teleopsis dalmanni]|uniref:uncharacterized protein LOC119686218 n=1 Tax=Teleopsis dalmanni TaxID=139649 RepID=UPI0018CD3D54|nr:uncharacterized protein LOC119686218 [Teleopsis dalmanni]